jgi:hypothetical protein
VNLLPQNIPDVPSLATKARGRPLKREDRSISCFLCHINLS